MIDLQTGDREAEWLERFIILVGITMMLNYRRGAYITALMFISFNYYNYQFSLLQVVVINTTTTTAKENTYRFS